MISRIDQFLTAFEQWIERTATRFWLPKIVTKMQAEGLILLLVWAAIAFAAVFATRIFFVFHQADADLYIFAICMVGYVSTSVLLIIREFLRDRAARSQLSNRSKR